MVKVKKYHKCPALSHYALVRLPTSELTSSAFLNRNITEIGYRK